MYLLTRTLAALGSRLRSLPEAVPATARGDRGDNPIPTAIIIAGLAIIAIALLGWLGFYVADFLNQAPEELPEAPF